MSARKTIGYKIVRIGSEPEHIQADSVATEGAPPRYVFRKDGITVRELFVHALETEPKAVFAQTPEQKAAWRKFVQKANAAARSSNLERG
jgi:hypothetical protein